jgi:hypothetical protein
VRDFQFLLVISFQLWLVVVEVVVVNEVVVVVLQH